MSPDSVSPEVHPHVCGEHAYSTIRPVRTEVHPHVCGEHPKAEFARRDLLGSSPRVWGASIVAPAASAAVRFIPTCVGSMLLIEGVNYHGEVHPHVCGEHYNHNMLEEMIQRFIPTCVGSMPRQYPPG